MNYDEVRQFFADLGRSTDGISSVVEFGTRRATGLSDIDIMVVVGLEDAITSNSVWADMGTYPEHVRLLLDGGAVKIVTEKQFAQLPLLGAMNTSTVFGDPIPQQSFSDRWQHLIHLADIMDWLAERIVTLNFHVRSKGAHPTRAINCAYSITHTFQRAVDTGAITENIAYTYRQEVDTFRSHWRESPQSVQHDLAPWLSDRLGDAMQLAVETGTFVETEGYYSAPAAAEQSRFRFNNGTLGFYSDTASHSSSAPKNVDAVVPGIWLAHLSFQSQLTGLISGEINKRIERVHLFSEVQIAPELRKLLTKRMALCNSIAGMLLPLGMRDNIYRFGHLLTPLQQLG